MLKLTRNELKEAAKMRGIKGYKIMSEDELLSALTSSKPVRKGEENSEDTKLKIFFFKPRIGKIRKEFNEPRHKFSKSKINDIRRNLMK